MVENPDTEFWQNEITPDKGPLFYNLKEVLKYRDLLFLLVRRDLVTTYKQTILGPLWYLIHPLIVSVIFTIMFNKIADIPTGGIPPFLFNLAGVTVWNFFRECLVGTSDTFKSNEQIFSKVYFPRLIMPLAAVFSNLFKFCIQLGVLTGFYFWFLIRGADLSINPAILLFPVFVVIMAIMGFGMGMIISSMVTKYRDLHFIFEFGVQLLLYLSAVVYPLYLISEKLPGYDWIVKYNPLAHLIETSRLLLLNTGQFSIAWFMYTVVVTGCILVTGTILFNKTEKTFIDNI